MYAPELVTAPATAPVSLSEAKEHLRVVGTDDDAKIEALIAAAAQHLDGWQGVLGMAIGEQTWAQEFDEFRSSLPLPLSPVMSIESVTWKDDGGDVQTVAAADYTLLRDGGGTGRVAFRKGFEFPTGLADRQAVRVEYVAGHETPPAPIKAAILLLIGHWFENREQVVIGTITSSLPFAVEALIASYRRINL